MRKSLKTALFFIGLLWIVHLANLLIHIDLRYFGLHPRNPDLWWTLFSWPLLHGSLQHLIANTVALFPLLVLAFGYNRRLTFKALALIYLLTGGLVWVFGRSNAVHIGASGIVFGLIGFLLFAGFFRKDWVAVAISLLVGLMYGGALASLLVYTPGLSWESHIFGFVSGIVAAGATRR
ncbi:MAG TPA: rhomboid family intramembrane serine protease [Desulfobacterales bacterium]